MKGDIHLKTLTAIVLFVFSTLKDGARAQQPGKLADTSPAWNDNSLMTIQRSFEDPTRSGNVRIEFYGHNAFKVTSPPSFRSKVAETLGTALSLGV